MPLAGVQIWITPCFDHSIPDSVMQDRLMILKARAKKQAAMRKNGHRMCEVPDDAPKSPRPPCPGPHSAPRWRCLVCHDTSHGFKDCPRIPRGILHLEKSHLMEAGHSKDELSVQDILERVRQRLAVAAAGQGKPRLDSR